MPETVHSALWGKKDRGARPRAVAVALAAVVALGAPAVARAAGGGGGKGDVPAWLLGQAKASPSATFDVIVQANDGTNPVDATVGAVASGSRKVYDNAVSRANDTRKKASDLVNQAAQAAGEATKAQQKAN